VELFKSHPKEMLYCLLLSNSLVEEFDNDFYYNLAV